MSAVILYVTARYHEEAVEIGRVLVEARLAACANILPSILSIYWWEGGVQQDQEVALILKTRQDLVHAAVLKIKDVHSYDCPCVISIPIEGGNIDYLEWIMKETIQ